MLDLPAQAMQILIQLIAMDLIQQFVEEVFSQVHVLSAIHIIFIKMEDSLKVHVTQLVALLHMTTFVQPVILIASTVMEGHIRNAQCVH